jgi:hypothetical protein
MEAKSLAEESMAMTTELNGTNETNALQCCVLCHRTLTDRAQHDALEERVLATLRAEHPEWKREADGARKSSVEYYRALLKQRTERVEGNRRLESIKMQRRRARRGKWLQGIKSLANAFSQQSAEALS